MMADVEGVEVVVAHRERDTLRVGDVFLKIDADRTRTDVEVEVCGGLEGAVRVLSMLRARRYRVLTIEVDLQAGSAGRALVVCELDLAQRGVRMLLARLERMPTVVSTRVQHR